MKTVGWIIRPTFVFLQPADLFEDGLQVHVESVAVAEQLQEVAGTHRAPGVVDELPGRGKPVGEDLKFLPLRTKCALHKKQECESETRTKTSEEEHVGS